MAYLKLRNKIAINKIWLFILGESVFFFVLNIVWVFKDKGYTFISDGAHIVRVLQIYRSLLRYDIQSILLSREMYPNLYHQVCAVFGFIFGDVYRGTVIAHTMFVIFLIFSTFLLVKTLWGEKVALVSSLLVPAFPGILHYSKICSIDIALSFFVGMAAYFLIKSDDFKDRRFTLLFFITSALGMLLKWAFLFFLIVPFLWVFGRFAYETIKEKKDTKYILMLLALIFLFYPLITLFISKMPLDPWGRIEPDYFFTFYIFLMIFQIAMLVIIHIKGKKTPTANVFLGFLSFFILLNHYYLYNFFYLINTYRGRFWGGIAKHLAERTPYYFFWEFLTVEYIGIYFLIMALAGLLFYVIFEKKDYPKNLLLSSIVSGMIILYMQPVYIPRYFFPLTPLVAGFMVFPFFKINLKPVKYALLFILIGFSIMYQSESFFPPRINLMPYSKVDRPSKEDWKVKEAALTCYWDIRNENTKKALIVLQNQTNSKVIKPMVFMFFFLNSCLPSEFLYLHEENLNLVETQHIPYIYYFEKRKMEVDEEGKDIEYEEEVSPDEIQWETINPHIAYYCHFAPFYKSLPSTEKIFSKYTNKQFEFKLIKEFTLPYANVLRIYKGKSNDT